MLHLEFDYRNFRYQICIRCEKLYKKCSIFNYVKIVLPTFFAKFFINKLLQNLFFIKKFLQNFLSRNFCKIFYQEIFAKFFIKKFLQNFLSRNFCKIFYQKIFANCFIKKFLQTVF